jgi:hypothetical protein
MRLQAQRFGSGSVLQSCSSWGDPKTALCAKCPSQNLITNYELFNLQLAQSVVWMNQMINLYISIVAKAI